MESLSEKINQIVSYVRELYARRHQGELPTDVLLLLNGPPLGGKGTHVKEWMREVPATLGLTFVGTGDEMRRIRSMYPEVDTALSGGQLAPARHVVPAVQRLLKQSYENEELSFRGLEGFPRSLEQALPLFQNSYQGNPFLLRPTAIISVCLECNHDVCRGRVAKRYLEEGRDDDKPATFATRYQKVYLGNRKPVGDVLKREAELHVEVAASYGTPEAIFEAVLEALHAKARTKLGHQGPKKKTWDLGDYLLANSLPKDGRGNVLA